MASTAKSSRIAKIICSAVLLCAIVVLLIVAICNNAEKRSRIPEPGYGVPAVYEEQLDINKISIDQIADDPQQIYLLDKYDGIIRVFDLSGNYKQTLLFSDYKNGAFRIAAKGMHLYVCDPQNNVYVFQDGALMEFLTRENATDVLKNVDFSSGSKNYSIRNSSVWKVSGETDICIIERPFYSLYYQGNVSLFIAIGVVIVFTVVRLYSTRKAKDHS